MNFFGRLFRRPAARLDRPVRLSVQALDERALPSSNTFSGLGAAGGFAVLAVNGGDLVLEGAHITGDVGLGPNADSELRRTDVSGVFSYDPSADVDRSRTFVPAGGAVKTKLSAAQRDANDVSAHFADLTPTRNLGRVTSSLTVTGRGGTNVFRMSSLDYNGDTLTLKGGANDVFVFNVSGDFDFHRSTIQLTGGVTANHVLFNFTSRGSDIDLSGASSVINGTFLAPRGSLDYQNAATLNGAVIARYIDIHANANINGGDKAPDQPAASSLSGLVFVDVNFNGTQQSGEASLGGITINLLDGTGKVLQTTQTKSDGLYSFTGLAAGTYQLQIVQPGGALKRSKDWVGTVNGVTNGSWTLGTDIISGIVLGDHDTGINYNFTEAIPS